MNRMLKVLIGLVLAVVIVWLLFTIVFPWVDRTLITDPTLEAWSPGSSPPLASEERYQRLLAWASRRHESRPHVNGLAVTIRVVRNSVEDRVSGLAAEMAFWALLSLLPLVVTISALLGYAERWIGAAQLERGRDAVVDGMSVVFSAELIADVVDPFITGLLRDRRGGIAVTTLIVGLYLTSRVFTATIRSLDLAYRVEERRGLIMQRLVALALAAGFVVVVVVTLLVMVVGPLLGGGGSTSEWLGQGEIFRAVWSVGRWPFLLLTMVLFLAGVYLYGPNVRNTFRSCLPGALLGVGTWTLASAALRFYIAAGGGGTPPLGEINQSIAVVARIIGTMVAALLWTYVTGFAILLGGELNAELERTKGHMPEQPDT